MLIETVQKNQLPLLPGISETRGNLKTKNNDSVGTSVGTQGIVVERHNKRMRSYNLHTMLTTNDKIRIK